MNRHARRTKIHAYRRDVHRDHILTFLIAADDTAALDGLLSRALVYWRSSLAQRRPFCPACRADFADGVHPGAFLFSTPPIAATSVSVTAFCTECWRDLTISDIEREVTRILRQVLPGGRLEPLEWQR